MELPRQKVLIFTKLFLNVYYINIAKVKWNEEMGSWGLQEKGKDFVGVYSLGSWKKYHTLKVIGNIHDNPELIINREK